MQMKKMFSMSLLFAVCFVFLSSTIALAYPNVTGDWSCPWMNGIISASQTGADFSATGYRIKLTGKFVNRNTVAGRWEHLDVPYTNEFMFVFSDNGNYIVDGYWDRGKQNTYSRSKIKGYRRGLPPN